MNKFNFQIISKDPGPAFDINAYKKYLSGLLGVAIASGTDVFQLRIKNTATSVFMDLAVFVRKTLAIYKDKGLKIPLFIVNDRPDIAFLSEADGAHIGQDDIPLQIAKKAFPYMVFGVSAKNREQAEHAQAFGADYIGIGPFFHTGSKEDAGKIINRNNFKKMLKNVKIPVIGIGGINYGDIEGLSRLGLNGAAVISAISDSPDPLASAKYFRHNIDSFMSEHVTGNGD